MGDQVLTFRASGKLWKGGLVLQDLETGSLWSQGDGRCIAGPLEGSQLAAVPSVMTTWSVWSRTRTDPDVLRKCWLARRKKAERQMGEGMRVLLLAQRGEGVAVPVGLEGRVSYVETRLGETPLLVVAGPDEPRAYERRHDGTELEFDGDGGALVDRATGSRWDPTNMSATGGPLLGASLRPMRGVVLSWSLLRRRYPDVTIVPDPALRVVLRRPPEQRPAE